MRAGVAASARALAVEDIRFGPDGLVPAIAQDARDGRVLMVAYQDREAVEATVRTGDAHFHSRSRDRLWRKGESSGNVLPIISGELDCDGDAILWTVQPLGPACHTGARSCFDAPLGEGTASVVDTPVVSQGFDWLETLWTTIEDRRRSRPDGSYTVRLLDGGVDAVGRKVAEEATEVLIAAKNAAMATGPESDESPRAALVGEVGDLLYHLLVLCAEREIDPADVLATLKRRHAA